MRLVGVASGLTNWTASVPLQAGSNSVSILAFDAAGNIGFDSFTVTVSSTGTGSTGGTTSPTVSIVTPTTGDSYSTTQSSINLTGSASSVITRVVWENSANGARGVASGTTSWAIANIPLQAGPNVIDVTATIIDLAGRGFLLIQEIPDEGLFSKTDWTLIKLEKGESELLAYERQLLEALFRDGNEVTVSELKTAFADRLHKVEASLYADAMRQKWFRARPDKVRSRWAIRGVLLLVLGVVLTVALALWTHLGVVGIPVIAAGFALAVMATRMPARTAKGTAMLRRIRGFRRVIATAEQHMARWAEEENVFTRYLPYAIVFGLTKKWAKAFEDLGLAPDTASWYVGTHPFTALAFADSIDGFAVTTGGTLASTPSSSGSSGFGGGGFSGGGGGGGGGGSW